MRAIASAPGSRLLQIAFRPGRTHIQIKTETLPAGGIISGQGGKPMNDPIFCLPNEERIIDRIEQLREYLDNFPDGMCAEAAKNELQLLGNIQEQWFI